MWVMLLMPLLVVSVEAGRRASLRLLRACTSLWGKLTKTKVYPPTGSAQIEPVESSDLVSDNFPLGKFYDLQGLDKPILEGYRRSAECRTCLSIDLTMSPNSSTDWKVCDAKLSIPRYMFCKTHLDSYTQSEAGSQKWLCNDRLWYYIGKAAIGILHVVRFQKGIFRSAQVKNFMNHFDKGLIYLNCQQNLSHKVPALELFALRNGFPQGFPLQELTHIYRNNYVHALERFMTNFHVHMLREQPIVINDLIFDSSMDCMPILDELATYNVIPTSGELKRMIQYVTVMAASFPYNGIAHEMEAKIAILNGKIDKCQD